MKKSFQFVLFIFFIVTCIGLVTLGIANYTILTYSNQIVTDIDNISTSTTALVFGGGMIDDTTMSDLQTDRVKRGNELYKKQKVKKLIMTGDDGQRRFNEVDAMQAYAVEHGVEVPDVSVDPHGYNTYSSCYRAKYEYQLEEIVAVSQAFHLPRIIYFCEHFGIDTIGVPADLREYGLIGRWWGMTGREILARLKGWWQVEVTEPGPILVHDT